MKRLSRVVVVFLLFFCCEVVAFAPVPEVKAQTSLNLRAADIHINEIKNTSLYYVANWSDVLSSMGVTTLRMFDGQDWHINMIDYPDTWDESLEDLLQWITAHGFNGYFYNLGDPWGGELGINDCGYPDPMNTTYVKSLIDKLAGDNSLSHNFLTDSRILFWNICNEVDFDSAETPNAAYYWTIEIADYMRSLGAKVVVPYPRLGGWDQYPECAAMLAGHVDYLDTHMYGLYQLDYWFSLGDNNYNWTGWEAWLNAQLDGFITSQSNFTLSEIILGEFGIWRDSTTDQGLVDYVFTDQNRIDYYTHYSNVIADLGIENLCFHMAFNREYESGDTYGMANGEGLLYQGYEVIYELYTGEEAAPADVWVPKPTIPYVTVVPSVSGGVTTYTSVTGVDGGVFLLCLVICVGIFLGVFSPILKRN